MSAARKPDRKRAPVPKRRKPVAHVYEAVAVSSATKPETLLDVANGIADSLIERLNKQVHRLETMADSAFGAVDSVGVGRTGESAVPGRLNQLVDRLRNIDALLDASCAQVDRFEAL